MIKHYVVNLNILADKTGFGARAVKIKKEAVSKGLFGFLQPDSYLDYVIIV
jgi:hypothetical protein